MDPNAVLRRIHEWLVNDMLHPGPAEPEIDEWCSDLDEWLTRGGFEPDWKQNPLGASYFECWRIQERKRMGG